jgi:septal ring factor EnvC (AmiA/AmiB activator)
MNEMNDLQISTKDLEKQIVEMKEGVMQIYTKLAEAESYLNAKKMSYKRILKMRKLPPEQAEQQRRIRESMAVYLSLLFDFYGSSFVDVLCRGLRKSWKMWKLSSLQFVI